MKDYGAVYVYQYAWKNDDTSSKNLEWQFIDKIIDNQPFPYAQFGASISLSDDSNSLLVGAPFHGSDDQGIVRLFQRNDGEDQYTQMTLPDDIDLIPTGENCGTSVSISKDGSHIAYGCPKASSSLGPNIGKVKILKKKMNVESDGSMSMTWIRSEIVGEARSNLFGTSVMLSNDIDGTMFVAIGGPSNARLDEKDQLLVNTGHVQVFYNVNDRDWEQAGFDMEGLEAGDRFGSSVAISGDGHIIIGGAPYGSGYAKIYKLDYTAPPTPAPTYHPLSLEKKKENSVWIVFLISTFSFLTLGMVLVLMKSLRNRRNQNFTGVRTDEDGLEMAGSDMQTASVEMRPNVVSSSGESVDII